MAAAADFTIIDESAYTGAMIAAILFAAARNSSACHLAFAARMGAFSVSHHITPYESRNLSYREKNRATGMPKSGSFPQYKSGGPSPLVKSFSRRGGRVRVLDPSRG
jgi:hypothetical protein